jgi:hypothetical protein
LRHINHLRCCRLDYINRLTLGLLHFNLLLLVAAQRSCGVCLGPQALNRGSDRSLIRQERLPNGGIVVDVLRHHIQHIGKIYQRDECRIELLLLRRIGERRTRQTGILLQPTIHIENLLRIGRRRRDLREQRIRVEGDWGE